MNHQLRITPAIRANFLPHSVLFLASISLCTIGMAGCGGINLTNAPAAAASSQAEVPGITSQPANTSVNVGQAATFTVAATGTGPLSYQWQQNLTNIAGATASAYTTGAVAATDSGATFAVVVSNAAGSATSSIATLTVASATPPQLSSQPQDQSVPVGQPASFSVTAAGTGPLNYQWRMNSAAITGATTPTYTIPAASGAENGASFDVIVSDSVGNTTSSAATLLVSTPAAASYYVATNGNDNADGSLSAPFATLRRAQLAMQSSAIKVTQINSGTYYLTSPLTLTSLDQGETWEAVPGATVVLSGGEVLSGWTAEGNGIYSTTASQPVGVDLAIDGVRQVPAAAGYDPQRPFTTGWRVLPSTQAHNFGVTFSVLPADFTAAVKPGATVQVLDFLRYGDQFTTILSVDPSTYSITVADQFNTGTTTPGVTGSWRILDDPSDLGAPGEFAYDAATGKVYLEPVEPDALPSETVVAAQLTTLISLNNVSGITVTGLTFSDTRSDKYMYSGAFNDKLATIMATGVSNTTISANTFLNVGNGIAFSGSPANSISGNNFSQAGGSGIFLTANSNHNHVTNNVMNGLGKINVGSTGIHLENSANNTVDSNTIDGSGRWGVDLYPTDGVSLVGNTISNNVIRNTSQQTNDTGAIYSYAGTNTGYVMENTVITGNRIENVGGLLRDGSGNYVSGVTEAIYMDDQVSGVTMSKNVVESGDNGMFLCHGCKSNSATNNLVVMQAAAYYDRGSNGVTYSSGDMAYNGTTRVDLLPSYFPAALSTTTIVVRLSGQAAAGANAAFSMLADGAVIGTATASSTVSDYVFTAPLTPHQVHRMGIALTNGATTGASTTSLHSLALFVNNTAVQLADPEATGGYGSYGFIVGNDNQEVTNFTASQNIVYRSAGSSQNLLDWTDWTDASYIDPNPGIVDYSVLYQNVAKAGDTVFGSQQTDAHSLLTDPAFSNAQAGDYTLLANSPALALGFNPAGVPLAP